MIALIIGLCTCLIFIFWQDCKFRHIHVSLPVVIFVCAYLLTNYIPQNIQFIATNVLFFSTTLFLLTLYMSLKNKAFLNPFKHYFGLGDLLFYVAITPLFLLYQYVLFFILSLVFAITMQWVLKKWITKESVPLAGLSALFLTLIIVKDLLFPFQKITLIR
jgi:hypothetical protein